VLRALTYLAQHEWGAPIPAGDIAETLNLPRRFLETQLATLAREGILESRRGTGGGCMLARDASDITALDVIEVLEGDVMDVPQISSSAASDLWGDVRETLRRELRGVTLADLAARQDRLDALRGPMYYI
jgi:Rrf2 family protein